VRVIIIVPRSKMTIRRTAIVFVDDINFYTNSRNYRNKIQRMLDIYIALYGVIGGAIQQDKSYTYE